MAKLSLLGSTVKSPFSLLKLLNIQRGVVQGYVNSLLLLKLPKGFCLEPARLEMSTDGQGPEVTRLLMPELGRVGCRLKLKKHPRWGLQPQAQASHLRGDRRRVGGFSQATLPPAASLDQEREQAEKEPW